MTAGRILIGTSGWHYDHWVGPLYPETMGADAFLEFYAGRFPTVEINNSFYKLPERSTLTKWRGLVPEGFVFACKASRYITHMKKLKDPERSTEKFFGAIDALGDKLGPILFQCPPRWHADAGRLRSFLEALPKGYRYAFEFRDDTWFTREVYDALARRGAAFCAFDLDRRRSPVELTADFAYVRLHGPDGPYRGSYDGRTLFGWARRFRNWRDDGIDVYCYFDNDEAGYAPRDALRLTEMLDRA